MSSALRPCSATVERLHSLQEAIMNVPSQCKTMRVTQSGLFILVAVGYREFDEKGRRQNGCKRRGRAAYAGEDVK